MVGFTCEIDADKILGGLMRMAEGDDIAKEMVEAGLEVMKKAIEEGASKHIVTGRMAASIRAYKPVTNKQGDIVGRIKFHGNDPSKKSKGGQSFDRTNWIKAFRIEYGTSNERAEPFVSPAILRSEGEIRKAMEAVFQERVKP